MADVVKYGIQIPNRVFVGGVAFDTKEDELREFFSKYGKIKECKIIKDNQSISRGFAFVTFESKHDAIQTQQLGTVFFKQKKLNLGPAIRQKGVVFNGAKEVENEPVLSTGVYIHPSGYSYTVAPNGVWYFHNSDGTPPSVTPGTPPMAYTSNIVQKTQNHARRSSTGSSTCGSVSPSTVQDTLPVFHGAPPTELAPITAPAPHILHPHTSYQGRSYVSNPPTYGSPNIHVAFQNMSISSHIPSHGAPTNQVHVAPAGPGHHPMHYTRMTEMYVPYYPQEGKVVTSCDGGMQRMNEHYLTGCAVQKPEYHPMIPSTLSHAKGPYMYPPYCTDPSGPTYIYPHHDPVIINEMQPGMYKKFITKPMYVKTIPEVSCNQDHNNSTLAVH
ncbi:deleted in azoospermia-like [Hydractinia symbiolongicarpus]|uniref:deleted in azoospermia-like n=1 Tax=Hydractinia symbiolongicarpus TaxID=13093 RepID=UPI00255110DF|nr:deleted in azoospermia-like [Hydractinia symbiolongicarpus]